MSPDRAREGAAPSVRVDDLRFTYPPSRASGDRGSAFRLEVGGWTVARGTSAALHGPSGCGKSTLLDLIAGVLRPESGRVEVEGRRLSDLSEAQVRAHRIRRMGFVFQDYPLVEYLDAIENVLFPYRLNPALEADESVRRRGLALLDELDLGPKAGRLPAELSQGERQRVAIARALIAEPRLLLADEPTAGLDPAGSRAVLETLSELRRQRGLTLIMVTHDPSLLSLFDQVTDVGAFSASSSDAS